MTESMPTVVKFDPGEPLDYGRLNSLVDAISFLNNNQSIKSAGTETYKTTIFCGTNKIPKAGEVGKTNSLAVTFGNGVSFSGQPVITVTPRVSTTNAIGGEVYYYLSEVSKTGFKINYSVNKAFSKSPGINFDWTAIYMEKNV